MVEIDLSGANLVFRVKGLHKIWALTSELEIPVEHIKSVRKDIELAKSLPSGIKESGVEIPGMISAGTFYQDGKRIFRDISNPENALVFELSDETYAELIVEVEYPDEAIALVEDAIANKDSLENRKNAVKGIPGYQVQDELGLPSQHNDMDMGI